MNGHKGSLRRGHRPAAAEPQAGAEESTLKTDQVQIERKLFLFALRENRRGRFLCVTEDSRGHRDRIIIPAPGLAEFKRVLEDMIHATEELPAPAPPPPQAVNQ